ncbi:hydantoinase/oxoprolinase [Aspergillus heterothallicus]
MSLYRIGVDVGGTNTDAVVLDVRARDTPGRGVLASHKASTTPDITSGIEAAIRAVLQESQIDQSRVLSVTIGTTHFINALVEADTRRLDRVAVVRLCGPFTRQIPPFSDFPDGLRDILDGGAYYLDGGFEIDGREIAPLNHEQIRQTAREIAASGVRTVALVGIFSPLDYDGLHEETCRKVLLEEASELRIVCSHDIGPTGLLERENATILNAAILRTGQRVKHGFQRAMARLGLACPLYLSQNDGTLIDADTAAEFPIKTFASGPTNSMTGAAFLAGIDQAKTGNVRDSENEVQPQVIVVDIGGTTTDVCALLPSGFPRQAPGFVEVGGVRTAFSMPEVLSIGLGGGSIVRVDTDTDTEQVTIGPSSVGHAIQQEAKIFGGKTLTTSDIVVALGKATLGDAALVQDVPTATVDSARKRIKRMLEGVIEQMKVSTAPVHVLLVGGGALLVTEDLDGVDKCIQPIHQGAANAVGAAIAKVSGDIDIVEMLEEKDEKAVVEAACQKAIDIAVSKGAARETVRVVEVNKMPLQYMHQGAMRIQIRAVGPLAVPTELTPPPSPPLASADESEVEEAEKNILKPTSNSTSTPVVDLETYRPDVKDGVWYVSETDLELIGTGCGILGTGGGGPTHHEYLKARHILRNGGQGKMRIVSPKSLKDDDTICFGSWYGSPSVINERIAGGTEISNGINAVNKILGNKSFQGIMLDEIGGGNGMSAFPTSVHFDIPIVDGDAMGRAYPTMYHATFSVYGHSLVPCVLSDARGNTSVVMSTDSDIRLEKILRTTAIELGLACAVCANPLPGSAIKSHGVPNTLSQAWYLGRAVHMAQRKKINLIDAIFDVCPGKLLFTGKIIDVRRHVGGGYTMGSVLVAPLSEEDREHSSTKSQPSSGDRHMIIPFQNEYLYASLCDADGSDASQEVVCTVPDLISILGQDGEAIGSQDLRYGLRVNVIALPAHPLWKTQKGLAVGGPAGFGLDMPFVGVGSDFTEARSVIEEFGV